MITDEHNESSYSPTAISILTPTAHPKMKTNKIVRTVAFQMVALFGVLSLSSGLLADQHKQIVNGREVVVHTNPIPVILHRLVPPQHGKHVTQKEVASGKVPQPRSAPATAPRKRS